VILVETVGVSASPKWPLSKWSTRLCFLTLARTGDQLQGIKKGVLELADVVVVNRPTASTRRRPRGPPPANSPVRSGSSIHAKTLWRPPVLTMSALHGTGLSELWDTVLKHRQVLTDAGGGFEARRRAQQVDWTWSMVRDTVLDRVLSHHASAQDTVAEVERKVPRRRAHPRACCAAAPGRG